MRLYPSTHTVCLQNHISSACMHFNAYALYTTVRLLVILFSPLTSIIYSVSCTCDININTDDHLSALI